MKSWLKHGSPTHLVELSIYRTRPKEEGPVTAVISIKFPRSIQRPLLAVRVEVSTSRATNRDELSSHYPAGNGAITLGQFDFAHTRLMTSLHGGKEGKAPKRRARWSLSSVLAPTPLLRRD